MDQNKEVKQTCTPIKGEMSIFDTIHKQKSWIKNKNNIGGLTSCNENI